MVRIASEEDLPALLDMADGVWETLPLAGRFNREHFRANLTALMRAGKGLIAADFADDGEPLCALGVAIGPEFNTGEIIAESIFFTANPRRKNASAFRVLKVVDVERKKRGAKYFFLKHLLDKNAKRTSDAFKRFGFVAAEVKYIKGV